MTNNKSAAPRPYKIGSRQIAVAGILTAMTVVTTVFTKIPFPVILGYFNLGDTVVLIAGAAFGGYTGAFAGAVGSAAADLLTGGVIFAPITFLVKGAEGLVAGALSGGGLANGASASGILAGGGISRPGKKGAAKARRLAPALFAAAAVMVAGYFLAEATVLAAVDRAFGLGAAVAELPFNLVQGGVSALLARVAIEGFRRAGVF